MPAVPAGFLLDQASHGITSDGRANAPVLLLAHGSGAPMDSPFLTEMAARLALRGLTVLRFEFAYMAARRTTGKRRPPPRADALLDAYRAAVADVRRFRPDAPLLIGGKSLGGRVASMIADDLHAARVIAGCVCLGYPFHPAKRPDKLRIAHLADLACPTLIVQGERDPLGNRSDAQGYALSAAIDVSWCVDGDHDLKPRASSGATPASNLDAAAAAIVRFAHAHA